jgi:hypothetical protein
LTSLPDFLPESRPVAWLPAVWSVAALKICWNGVEDGSVPLAVPASFACGFWKTLLVAIRDDAIAATDDPVVDTA